MSYELSVDLGTTFTAAAVSEGSGGPTMVGLGNRALQIPSVLFRTDAGFLVGEAADRRGSAEPRRLVREFKRRLGDPVPILVDGSPYSPETLMATLLRWVVDAVTRRQGGPPSGVVLTHPASWGSYKLDVLGQVAVLAEVEGVTWCPEPVAAAGQYASRARVEAGARLGVYDLGGGTFDACVLEKTPNGFAMLGPAEGVEHLGGVDFDEAVFEQVRDALSDRLDALDRADPATTAGLARLRRECVEAKEALSVDAETVVPVALPGLVTSVRVTRAELEHLIGPAVDQSAAAMGRAVRAAGLEPKDLDGIVLIGGSSRIPLVGEVLHRAFDVPTALDTHPKHDVALGALQARAVEGADATSTVVTDASAVGTTGRTRRPRSFGRAPGEARPVRGDRRPSARAHTPAREPLGTTDPRTTAPPPPVPPPPTRPTARSGGAGSTPGTPPAGPVASAPAKREAVREEPAAAIAPRAPQAASPAEPSVRRPSRRTLLIFGAAVLAVLVIAAVIVVPGLFRDAPDQKSAGAPAGTQPAGSSSPASPAPSSSVAALPQSAPLADDQLLVSMAVGGNTDLYLASTGSPAPLKRLTSDADVDAYPVLSPDRRSVIYQRYSDTDRRRRSLRVAAVDGSGDRELVTKTPAACARSMGRPAWDPADPTVLAAVCRNAANEVGLYRLSTDGAVMSRIPLPGLAVGDPTFSTDGAKLAFWSASRADWNAGDIYVVNADGTGSPVKITTSTLPTQYADPDFSPDGLSVAYRRRDPGSTPDGDAHIYVVNADGSGTPTPLATTPGANEQDPSYSPQGDQIAYMSDRDAPGLPGGAIARVWVMGSDGRDPHVLLTQDAGQVQTSVSWARR